MNKPDTMDALTELLSAIDDNQHALSEGEYLKMMNLIKDVHAHAQHQQPNLVVGYQLDVLNALHLRANILQLRAFFLLMLTKELQKPEPRTITKRELLALLPTIPGIGPHTVRLVRTHAFMIFKGVNTNDPQWGSFGYDMNPQIRADLVAIPFLSHLLASIEDITAHKARLILGHPTLNTGPFLFRGEVALDPIPAPARLERLLRGYLANCP